MKLTSLVCVAVALLAIAIFVFVDDGEPNHIKPLTNNSDPAIFDLVSEPIDNETALERPPATVDENVLAKREALLEELLGSKKIGKIERRGKAGLSLFGSDLGKFEGKEDLAELLESYRDLLLLEGDEEFEIKLSSTSGDIDYYRFNQKIHGIQMINTVKIGAQNGKAISIEGVASPILAQRPQDLELDVDRALAFATQDIAGKYDSIQLTQTPELYYFPRSEDSDLDWALTWRVRGEALVGTEIRSVLVTVADDTFAVKSKVFGSRGIQQTITTCEMANQPIRPQSQGCTGDIQKAWIYSCDTQTGQCSTQCDNSSQACSVVLVTTQNHQTAAQTVFETSRALEQSGCPGCVPTGVNIRINDTAEGEGGAGVDEDPFAINRIAYGPAAPGKLNPALSKEVTRHEMGHLATDQIAREFTTNFGDGPLGGAVLEAIADMIAVGISAQEGQADFLIADEISSSPRDLNPKSKLSDLQGTLGSKNHDTRVLGSIVRDAVRNGVPADKLVEIAHKVAAGLEDAIPLALARESTPLSPDFDGWVNPFLAQLMIAASSLGTNDSERKALRNAVLEAFVDADDISVEDGNFTSENEEHFDSPLDETNDVFQELLEWIDEHWCNGPSGDGEGEDDHEEFC